VLEPGNVAELVNDLAAIVVRVFALERERRGADHDPARGDTVRRHFGGDAVDGGHVGFCGDLGLRVAGDVDVVRGPECGSDRERRGERDHDSSRWPRTRQSQGVMATSAAMTPVVVCGRPIA
jgi:hypothetical protein